MEAAEDDFMRERNIYYNDRYEEMEDQDLLPAARVIAQAFQNEDTLSTEALRDRLMTDLGISPKAAKPVIGHLAGFGYSWRQPTDARWERGIPSLMNYMLDTVPAGPPMESPASPDGMNTIGNLTGVPGKSC